MIERSSDGLADVERRETCLARAKIHFSFGDDQFIISFLLSALSPSLPPSSVLVRHLECASRWRRFFSHGARESRKSQLLPKFIIQSERGERRGGESWFLLQETHLYHPRDSPALNSGSGVWHYGLWHMARGEGEREERVKNSTGLKGVPVSALGFCRSIKGE